MGEAPTTIRKDGKTGKRNRRAERVAVPGASCWPMKPCVASGVHPSQAQKLRDYFKKHGLNVQVNDNGDPIYESVAQRKRALKIRGIHDNTSFD